MHHRAYGLLHIKAVDAETRTITGIATTPAPDRVGDVIEPLGVRFKNPLPLLLFHDTRRPVGVARFDAPTAAGIAFTATLPTVTEAGTLRERVEDAWQSIKAGVISGVSIGYRALTPPTLRAGAEGLHFAKTEVLELSLVSVPANADATILTVKSLDLAASGRHSPGDSGRAPARADKAAPHMTTTEQITQFEATRAANAARMTALMDTAAKEAITLDATQTDEYDALAAANDSVDAHLVRLRALEKSQAASATAIADVTTTKTAEAVRSGRPVITVKANVPPGTAFVRAACALLVCKGNTHEAAEYARQRWESSTPEVATYLKAAIAAGNTTDATWAGPLVNAAIANDFLELLRPATILGKISGLRQVPFNTKVPSQTGGGTYGWVGESKPKPLTKLAFGTDTLTITKAAGIIVLTEELVRLSNPSAEALARADMVAGIAQFLDAQFIDPAVAAVAGVNPASITNGAPTAAATVAPLADLLALMQHFATNNIPLGGVAIIMSEVNALSLSFHTNTDGSPMFPGLTAAGGTARGLQIITSQAAAGLVVGLQPSLILYADEGGVTIDASREASLQMDSAPMSPADATTVYVSLWQNNLVGLRAERFVNWKRANANAVKYLTGAAYPAPSGLSTTTTVTGPSRGLAKD